MPRRAYRLKAGSHSIGVGKDLRIFKAKDMQNNVVESDENLAQLDPQKWELYEGPMRMRGLVPGESGNRGQADLPTPPPPPTPMNEMEAMAMSAGSVVPLSAAENKRRAQALRAAAERLEAQAELQEDAEREQAKGQRGEQSKAQRQPVKGRVDEDEDHTQNDEASLEELTVAELRDLAESEQVELVGLSRKDDIIEAIRDARKNKEGKDE